MSKASVLVVGESRVDMVVRPDGTAVEHAGGSAASVAVALARLGRPVQSLTASGDDEQGAVLECHLNEPGAGIVGDSHTLRTAWRDFSSARRDADYSPHVGCG
jgi:fructokinase